MILATEDTEVPSEETSAQEVGDKPAESEDVTMSEDAATEQEIPESTTSKTENVSVEVQEQSEADLAAAKQKEKEERLLEEKKAAEKRAEEKKAEENKIIT